MEKTNVNQWKVPGKLRIEYKNKIGIKL